MKRFAALYDALDRTTSTNAKVAAMVAVLPRRAAGRCRVGGVLSDGPPAEASRPVAAIARLDAGGHGLEGWLLDECYAVVGDGAETAALVLDQVPCGAVEPICRSPPGSKTRILPLRELDPAAQQATRHRAGGARSIGSQRFILIKLLTGEFRVGVSHTLVVRALAQAAELPATTDRGAADGRLDAVGGLVRRGCCRTSTTDDDRSRPYPFFLASPLEESDRRRSAIRARVARRVEVGRHPRAAGPARRRTCTSGRAAKS